MKRSLPFGSVILIATLAPLLFGAPSKRLRPNQARGLSRASAPSGPRADDPGRRPPRNLPAKAGGRYRPHDQPLSDVSRLSVQLEGFASTSAFPVQLGNGNVMIVYASDYENTVYCAQSPDGGATWGEKSTVATGASIDLVTGIRTRGGRILALWKEYASGGAFFACHSDDDGETWSEPAAFTGAGLNYLPRFSETADGRIWFFWSRTEDWMNYTVVYRTSGDGGDSWAEERVFPSDFFVSSGVQMVSLPGAPDRAVYSDAGEAGRIVERETTDGGLTWAEPRAMIAGRTDLAHPRVLAHGDGSLTLVTDRLREYFWNERFDYTESDVEFRRSTDGGATWSEAVPLTRYAGFDETAGACLVNDAPFVAFISDRWRRVRQVWCGLPGLSVDASPPPVFIGAELGGVRPGRPAAVAAVADDETAVTAVTLTVSVNGTVLGPVSMSDDGAGADTLVGDRRWSAVIGPFEADDKIEFLFAVSDAGGHTVESGWSPFVVPAVHDAGNMVLEIHDNSMLGRPEVEDVSAYWPREGGDGYLALGGLWVGTTFGGVKRVVNLDWEQTDWYRTEGTRVTLAPGVSDQDGSATYDDQRSWSDPVGLGVHQQTFQWSAPTRDDFILLRYTVRNSGHLGDLDSVFVASWTDPDAGFLDGWWNNLTGYDAERSLLYAWNPGQEPPGYFGVRFLGPGAAPHGAVTYGIDVPPGDPGDDETRFGLLADGRVTLLQDTADCRLLLTAPPFRLAAGESLAVTFGIVLGNGLAELRANADTLKAVFDHLNATAVADRDGAARPPRTCELGQNYPNPFNPSTTVAFTLPSDRRARVTVYDATGREVAVLADGFMKAGRHRAEWNAAGYGSGVYVCRLEAGDFSAARKMLLMK